MCDCNKNISKAYNPPSKFEGGGCVSCDLNHFDISELDNYETMLYNDYIKHSSKEESLQLLINSVEGDYSQLSPKLAEIAEKYYGDVEYANGGGVGNIESEINELYSKFNFINDDFNWKMKLLEMLQDRSIEAYNIYQSLSENQKEEVLQELFEADNDMGSYGDGELSTSKENLDILLEDAKNGNKLPYSNGGGVGEEKYILSDYSVTVFEDIYKEFIFGEWLKSPRTNRGTRKIHSSEVFTKHNEKIEKTYNSIESLIKDMNKIMRMRVNGLQYSKQDFDWQIDKGYIKTDVLVDEDLDPPNGYEVEAWAKGRYNLYNAHYLFNVRIENEYANGGGIGKAMENLHSKASKGTTERGKNKFKFPVELYAISVPEYEYKFNGSAIGKYIDTGVNNPNTGKNMVYYVLQIAPKDELIELRPLGYRSGISTKFEYVKDFGYTELVNDKDKYANGGGVGEYRVKAYTFNDDISPSFNGSIFAKNDTEAENKIGELFSKNDFYQIIKVYRGDVSMTFEKGKLKWDKYSNGGGVGCADTCEDKLSIPSKSFSKSSEDLVKDNLFDGEISVEKLRSIIGREPSYPTQIVGSMKLTKCFLKPFYKI